MPHLMQAFFVNGRPNPSIFRYQTLTCIFADVITKNRIICIACMKQTRRHHFGGTRNVETLTHESTSS